MSLPRITFTVWSDVLCPWCYNAAVCLERLRDEMRREVELTLVRKAYLLRPYPEPKPMDRFRRYTESWLKPAGQPDAGEFRVWATDEAPPSHSIPPNVAVKAAGWQGELERYHMALMHAYFARNLNVTARENILRVAAECGLDTGRFENDFDDPALAEQVLSEHNEAVELGISGVPCVVLEGGSPSNARHEDALLLPGSQDRAVYRNVIHKLIARQGAA